jgi:hypothetical protein
MSHQPHDLDRRVDEDDERGTPIGGAGPLAIDEIGQDRTSQGERLAIVLGGEPGSDGNGKGHMIARILNIKGANARRA